MYAIVELGGRQWKVEPGTRMEINRLSTDVGAQHKVERVLLAHDGTTVQVGSPYVQGVSVVCEVLEHHKGPKIISYHFRRRENWRKTVGHRQPLTRLLVKEILFPGSTSTSTPTTTTATARPAETSTTKPKAAAKPRAKKADAPARGTRPTK